MKKEEVFDYIYTKFRDTIMVRAKKDIPDDFMIDDICQDVFHDFYNKMEEINCTDLHYVRSWLLYAMDYKVNEYKRAYSHEQDRVNRAIHEKRIEMFIGRSAEDLYMKNNEKRKMKDVLDSIMKENPKEMELLFKIKYEEQSPKNVAKEYGISIGALYTKLSRIRSKLRHEMADNII